MAHNTGMHDCAADGCKVQVTAQKLMCWPHWKSVPRRLQDEVNFAWRNVKRDPEAYREARERAVAAVGKSTPKQGNLL